MRACWILCLSALLMVAAIQPGYAVDKGHQILINRGVQSFALANTGEPFDINKVKGANFTGVMWIWNSYDAGLLGPAPGINWSRWVNDPGQQGLGDMSDMPPTTSTTNEAPYMQNLVSVALGDEQYMNDATIRNNTINWFNTVRNSYPNSILWTNSWGYELTDSSMDAYIQGANPDMLSMDTYEFVVGNGRTVGGSPSYLYHSMRQVRAFANAVYPGQSAWGRPYQLYTQTYHASTEGDGFARRDPSDSELRLNYFAGVSFGFTSFANFRYGSGNTSLFTGNTGDNTTGPLYNTMTDINAKLKKLSPALTRLKPKLNYISGIDAAMCYQPGQYLNAGTTTTLGAPSGDFKVYPTDYGTWFAHNNNDWVSVSNSGTWRGMTVTNIGTKNNGLRGDVWMMWFTPLDEAFDGPSYSNEEYIMILNGLSDSTGTGVDCRQTVKLNLINNTKSTNLLVLNQQTGNVDTVPSPLDTGTGRRTPTFTLDGGELVLFKYDTGAPFVGFYQTAADNWSLYD